MIAVADEFKAVFGDGVKLVYVREGDDVMGNPNKEQGKWVTPYVPKKVEAKHGR
jgi:hypothetical protein